MDALKTQFEVGIDEKNPIFSTMKAEMKMFEKKQKCLSTLKDLFKADKSTIKLNIGGRHIGIKRETLFNSVNSNNMLLFSLICGKYDHLLPKDRNGRIYLDFCGEWIVPWIDFARDMAMWNGEDHTKPIMSQSVNVTVNTECTAFEAYLGIVSHSNPLPILPHNLLISQSKILKELPIDAGNAILNMVTEQTGKSVVTAILKYRGAEDGFRFSDVKRKCNDCENPLFIIRGYGNVFGAFCDTSYGKNAGTYLPARSSFLFSLRKNGVYQPRKHTATRDCNLFYGTSSAIFSFDFAGCNEFVLKASSTKGTACGFCKISRGFHLNGATTPFLTNQENFSVCELEVFSLQISDSVCVNETSNKCRKNMDIVEGNNISGSATAPFTVTVIEKVQRFPLSAQYREAVRQLELIQKCSMHLITADYELTCEAIAFRDELKFVAKYVGIALPVNETLGNMQNIMNEIELIVKVLTVNRAVTSSMVADAAAIVYINAGGTVLAVSKATLLQAPSGSILANMASDVWGHDLDSEGNIFQDVNSKLFTAIINHLRLKALLLASEVPPITVYEEQKTALDNLLAFYMLSDLPVKTVKNPQK